jgi:hypothetical protein
MKSMRPTTTDRTSVYKPNPELNTYYNSVSVYVGKQGGAKTSGAITEAVALAAVDPKLHLIVVIMKKAFDPTIEAAKRISTAPIVSISYRDAVEFMQQRIHTSCS